MSILEQIKRLLYATDPRLGLLVHAWYYYAQRTEPEIRLLPLLCNPAEISIDVGAHIGIYTYFLRRHSRSVVAIEPIPALATQLRRSFRTHVEVEEVAVSRGDSLTEVQLKLPELDGAAAPGRATVEPTNALFTAVGRELRVPCRTLDSIVEKRGRIGFVKIDVEGHEHAVLEGAQQLIVRDAPSFLIEVEDRHSEGSLARVRNTLVSHGYRGFFLLNDRLLKIDDFDLARHQRVGSAGYVYNFVFTRRPQVIAALSRLG